MFLNDFRDGRRFGTIALADEPDDGVGTTQFEAGLEFLGFLVWRIESGISGVTNRLPRSLIEFHCGDKMLERFNYLGNVSFMNLSQKNSVLPCSCC